MNEIYLRRANKVMLEKGENQISDIVIATMAKNIENLGYTFSLELFKTLKTLSMPNLVRFNAELVANLKKYNYYKIEN